MDKKQISRLATMIRPYLLRMIIITILIVIIAALNLVVPMISRSMIDNGFVKKNYSIIFMSIVQIYLVYTSTQILTLLKEKVRIRMKNSFVKEMFKSTFLKLTKINIQYLKENNNTEIMDYIGTDVGAISQLVDESFFLIFSQIVRVVGGTIGLLLISPKLTILIFLYIPIKLFIMHYMEKKKKAITQQYILVKRSFAHWFGDTVAGIQEIRLHGISEPKMSELEEVLSAVTKTDEKRGMLESKNVMAEGLLSEFITNLVYIVGAGLIINEGLSLGSVLSFVTYSMYVLNPLAFLTNIRFLLAGMIPSVNRFFEFMDMEEEDYHEGIPCQDEIQKVEFHNVSFGYDPNKHVLKKISFSVSKKEKVAIIGANGTGKSTIIHLLLRLYEPCEGEIILNGEDINNYELAEYRSLFGVISQNIYLFDATIEQNIKLYSDITKEQYETILKECNLYDFSSNIPKDYKIGQNGMMLSGGQRQKIAISRAIIKNKPIFIFDEATSNIDIESEKMVHHLFNNKLKDKIVFVITHGTDYLDKYDKIIFISNGIISGIGKHTELMAQNAKYQAYIGSDIR